MKIARIWTDADGQSHLDEIDWRLTDDRYCESPEGYTITPAWPATGARFIRTPAGFVDDWHPVPDRMISVLLTGTLLVEVGDGASMHLTAGQMILCDDTHGTGHRMNETRGQAYDMLLVTLPDDRPL